MSNDPADSTSLRTDDLLVLACAAADAAADVLMDGASRGAEQLSTWSKSSATDMASEMDVAAEAAVVRTLLSARPGDRVLGEEGGDQSDGAADDQAADPAPGTVRWVVDPLDGTTNYLYGLPHWAVSIAATIDGRTVVGVVQVPMTGERFWAVLGGGAWLEAAGRVRHRLRLLDPPNLAEALVATGFGYAEQRRREQADVVGRVLPAVRDIRRLGAAAIDLCHVACGRVDAYYERGLQPWDLAAGELVAREAGARVEGLDGVRAGESMVIAAADPLFGDLHALIAGP